MCASLSYTHYWYKIKWACWKLRLNHRGLLLVLELLPHASEMFLQLNSVSFMVRIFLKRDSNTKRGYDSTSESSEKLCRRVSRMTFLGRCRLNSKLVKLKGTSYFSSTISQGANHIPPVE